MFQKSHFHAAKPDPIQIYCNRRRKSNKKIVMDTNVIAGWEMHRRFNDGMALHKSINNGSFVYTKTVDEELGSNEKEYIIKPNGKLVKIKATPEQKNRVHTFRKDHGPQIVQVKMPSDEVLKKIPVKGNDKKIAYEAETIGADAIVTNDKYFILGGKKLKVDVIDPKKYLSDPKYENRRKK